MKKLLLALFALAVVLTGYCFAADTSVTINVRKSLVPVGLNATFSLFKATATSAAASAGSFTFDLPIAPGKTTNDVLEVTRQAYTANGAEKPLNIVVSGSVVTVSNSNMTSGTIAAGDIVRGVVYYKQ